MRDNVGMRISARADYAVRAALQLASSGDGGPLKAEAIADAQDIPHKFLESILNDMRRGGLVVSQRGGNGGYRLAKPADAISIADVIRVVEGPLVSVRGVRPPELSYPVPPSRCCRCGSRCGRTCARSWRVCPSPMWRRPNSRPGWPRWRTPRRPG